MFDLFLVFNCEDVVY